MDYILSQDLAPRRPDWIVDNDAMDGDSPVLFAYTCDMPRIKRFATALELHGKTGTLFCFDFQEGGRSETNLRPWSKNREP